jgi:hypothetical protein
VSGDLAEIAVAYCHGGDCEFVPSLRRRGRGGDFPAEFRGIAPLRNPPVSPVRKGRKTMTRYFVGIPAFFRRSRNVASGGPCSILK